jgi:hypothetical protein
MLSNQMKSIIAESCPGYEGKYILSMAMGNLAQSCNDCANFVRGKCTKDLLHSIKEKIERN